MTIEKYTEAKKKVMADKHKENFMVITFGYDNIMVLPYKDGLAVMANLVNAERLDGDYNKKYITEVTRDKQSCQIMSYKEYERYKIAALLNITYDEVKQYESPQAENTP